MTNEPASIDSPARSSPARPNALGRTIGTAAIIVMFGNLLSSGLGFIRGSTIAAAFGQTGGTDAWVAASIVPQMFYDLTIGAAISAALIPTFTTISESRGMRELSHTVGEVLGLVWTILAVLVALLVLGAHPLMTAILWSNHAHPRPSEFAESVKIARILVVSLFFLGTSAVLLSALYSIRRFTAPAFATGLYHVGIIGGAVLLARPLGILSLAVGAVAGSAAQTAVQLPFLLRAGLRPRIRVSLTPEVRRIIKLYGPVAVGLLVSMAGQILDLNFKWKLHRSAVTAMFNATTLTQFPIGIAVAALSFAILPSISSDASAGRMSKFKDTLASGIKLALFLTIPAALAYLVLATPIVGLLFEHRRFTGHDTTLTASALAGYAAQIPFVGVDQLLIFSFYARKDTMTPMLVGVAGVGIYVAAALALGPRFGIVGLALANTLQNSLHALILLVIMITTIGGLSHRGVLKSVGKTAMAGAAMSMCALGSAAVINATTAPGLLHRLVLGLVPLIIAALVFMGTAALVRSDELASLLGVIRSRAR